MPLFRHSPDRYKYSGQHRAARVERRIPSDKLHLAACPPSHAMWNRGRVNIQPGWEKKKNVCQRCSPLGAPCVIKEVPAAPPLPGYRIYLKDIPDTGYTWSVPQPYAMIHIKRWLIFHHELLSVCVFDFQSEVQGPQQALVAHRSAGLREHFHQTPLVIAVRW